MMEMPAQNKCPSFEISPIDQCPYYNQKTEFGLVFRETTFSQILRYKALEAVMPHPEKLHPLFDALTRFQTLLIHPKSRQKYPVDFSGKSTSYP